MAGVLTIQTCETWLPVTGRFKTYALDVERVFDDEPVYRSKGHHEPSAFLLAAQEAWLDENGPLDHYVSELPPRLRKPENVRLEWWATRMGGCTFFSGYSHFVETVQPYERGAYPVTVVDA